MLQKTIYISFYIIFKLTLPSFLRQLYYTVLRFLSNLIRIFEIMENAKYKSGKEYEQEQRIYNYCPIVFTLIIRTWQDHNSYRRFTSTMKLARGCVTRLRRQRSGSGNVLRNLRDLCSYIRLVTARAQESYMHESAVCGVRP